MRWTARPSAGASSPSRRAPDKRLATIVDSYLTPVHRDDPGHGCAVPALGAEIARESPKTRKAFAAKLEQMIDMMAEQIPDVPRKAARKQAMAALATMMGTLVLARVAGNGEFSDEILGAGREAVLDRATPPKPAAKKSAPRRPQRRHGIDSDLTAIAFDVGRSCPKRRHDACIFANRAARRNPFQTPQRLQDAAKIGTRTVSWRNACAQSDISSAAARSRAHRARFADVFRADDRRRPGQGGAGLQGRTARRGRERQGRAAGMGARPIRSAAPAC